jgi:hypothetical protein
MKSASASGAWWLVAGLLTAGCAAAAPGSCFTDVEQDYEWDDAGFNLSAMPDLCGSGQPASPSERRWGGSMKIRASGNDASLVQQTYAWVPERNGPAVDCPRFFRTVTTTTKVAKNGVLTETRQVDGEAPTTKTRKMHGTEMMYVANLHSVPRPNDAFVEVSGSDTIAGQPCQRVEPKAGTPGAGTWQMCLFVAPVDCRAASYVQPLELLTRGPDGRTFIHGRTTRLLLGERGLVAPDSIRAP